MPHFTLSVGAAGPLLKARFTVSEARAAALVREGMELPNVPAATALLDTGASCTCVDPSILAALGLTPKGEADVLTPSTTEGPERADEYDCGLFIFAETTENPYFVRNIPVLASPLRQQGIDALIGRDVLAKCVLVYNGSTSIYTLAF